ncbi:MAG: type II toxin-antitoxin system Phd/YefM family antitoxin [Betaproteobacteria bacterium]|nr:type II toxin-antitoxin system Phd/YefM family antitoxin [Betaproteobacteria bacterium]
MSTLATTYTRARAALAALCDEVIESRDAVIIRRRGKEDVALIAATELRSLLETAHLTASPANARRLTRALRDAKAGRNMTRLSAGALRTWSALPVPEKRGGRRKP